MFRKIPLLILLVAMACKSGPEETNKKLHNPVSHNTELQDIYLRDQADRKIADIDWETLTNRDSLRRARVGQLLDSNLVRTSKDYHNAAMIFQHGNDSVAYGMAVSLMRKAIKMDSTANKWLLAAAIDRHLLSRNRPQIYGTQYQKIDDYSPWTLSSMDTTQISDDQRRIYGVPTLAEQREKLKAMNAE